MPTPFLVSLIGPFTALSYKTSSQLVDLSSANLVDGAVAASEFIHCLFRYVEDCQRDVFVGKPNEADMLANTTHVMLKIRGVARKVGRSLMKM